MAKYLHPQCFACHSVAVDYAPTGRAKCKDTAIEIPKGEMRCVLRLVTCEGQPKDPRIYRPDSPFLVSFLRELTSLPEVTESTDSISNRLDGPSEHTRWLADALSGAKLDGRTRPTRQEVPQAADGAAKRKAPASNTTKKKRPREEERAGAAGASRSNREEQGVTGASDDGEAVD